MLKNHFKIAWRNLIKHKLYSAIKIGGFAFSIAACALIALFIQHEVNYDRSYPDADQLYRAVMTIHDDGGLSKGTSFMAPFAPTMKADFPEVEHAGRLLPNPLFGAGSNQVSTAANPESLYEDGVVYADQELLDVLQLPMAQGSQQHALDEPNTVLLTASKAMKYFPEGNPTGKVIYLNDNNTRPYTVKGVLEDIPDNSHLYGFAFFLSLAGEPFYTGEQINWMATNYITYFKLRPGTDIRQLGKKMAADLVNNHYIPAAESAGRQVPEYDAITKSKGDIRFVWLFGGIVGFILLIACINFSKDLYEPTC